MAGGAALAPLGLENNILQNTIYQVYVTISCSIIHAKQATWAGGVLADNGVYHTPLDR